MGDGLHDRASASRRGERVEGLVYRLKGDMAYAITHPGGDRLDAEVVTVPDGLKQRDAGGRHAQAGTAQLLGGGGSLGGGHGAKRIVIKTNDSIERTIQILPHRATSAPPGRDASSQGPRPGQDASSQVPPPG